MSVITHGNIMLDNGPAVDDHAPADFRAGVDYGTGHYNRTLAEAGCFRDRGRGMDRYDEHNPPALCCDVLAEFVITNTQGDAILTVTCYSVKPFLTAEN